MGTRGRYLAVVLLATVLQVLAPTAGAPADEPSRLLATVGALLALAQGLALWLRRGQPGTAGLLVVASWAAQVLLVQPVPPYVGLVAVWAAVRHGASPVVRMGVPGAVLAGLGLTALRWPDDSSGVPLAVAVTVGVALSAALLEARAARTTALADRAAAEERLRIARDLHDLVGHGLTGIAVQSSTARLAVESGDSAVAMTALRAVEAGTRDTLSEVRQLLGVLRSEQSGAPTHGLADLPAIAGDAPLELSAASVTPAVGLTAYRVVQEALTNSRRHAPGAAVRVRVVDDGNDLLVQVDDDGPGRQPTGAGHGIAGMRERVAACGGRLDVGPRDGGGWRVEARLPRGGA